MAASKNTRISTTSTCTLEECGEHMFKIDGYSLCKGIGVGRFIQSATFAVGGYVWRLRYYPDGDTDASKDCMSVHLDLLTMGVEVRVLCHLTLMEHATPSAQSTWPKPTKPVVLNSSASNISSLANSRLVKRSHLEASSSSYLYIREDVILIKCELPIIKIKEPKTDTDFGIHVPPSDLSVNLRHLLEAGEESDVSFQVKDEVFTAHKIILAMRSPVFKAELYGPMRDAKCGQKSITIEDMEPTVFKLLLHFINTDKLPPEHVVIDDEVEEEMFKHLLVAADRYAMERMKLMCERTLCEFLEAKTVASTLALADQHHCSKLKDACIGFINNLDRMDDVMTSTGYEHLKRACPTIFIDIWEKADSQNVGCSRVNLRIVTSVSLMLPWKVSEPEQF
ncbi:unnamed protein product [Alopecurus aequalis]